MSSDARLERLNAYLISKGRPPKSGKSIDFVKQNKTLSKQKQQSTVLRESGNKTPSITTSSNAARKRNATPLSSQKITPAKAPKLVAHGHNSKEQRQKLGPLGVRGQKKTTPKPNPGRSIERVPKENRQLSKQTKTPSKNHTAKTPVKSYSERMHKKLVRRSMNIAGNRNTPVSSTKRIEKTPIRKGGNRQHASLTPASHFRKQATKTPKSTGPHRSASRSVSQKDMPFSRRIIVEQAKMYEKLNNWLIAKGKKPLDGIKIRGFKPTKTISTPVASPVQKKNQANGSHWPGLKDEDENDEMTVLIRHAMDDVVKCIDEGCFSDVLRPMLEELASKLPAVKQEARYWVTLAQIDKKAGKSDQEICDLFEQAIVVKARPLDEIKDALKNMVVTNAEGEKTKVENSSTPSSAKPGDDEQYFQTENFGPISTMQCKTPNPLLDRIIRAETPEMRNAATSPIVFDSPKSIGASPSSVIKLKMVSRLSPIFNRFVSSKALPSDTSAIVTPVRRSQRIFAAQHSYPRGLQDHEPCLATVQEMLPVLNDTYCGEKNGSKISCDIIFNPNLALGDEYKDLATVLKF